MKTFDYRRDDPSVQKGDIIEFYEVKVTEGGDDVVTGDEVVTIVCYVERSSGAKLDIVRPGYAVYGIDTCGVGRGW